MSIPNLARLGVLVSLMLTACVSVAPETETDPTQAPPRNVIFMLGDGMGFAHVKAYRMYADNPATELVEPLPMEAYQVGSVSTDSIRLDCSGEECIRDPHGFTDSASSATAYATGHDTIVGQLSVNTEGNTMPTILESARRHGKATGLVATSQVTHASPAAFGSHVPDRDERGQIADQYFDHQWQQSPMIDVLLGGGSKDLCRADRDLVPEFREAGYEVLQNREELLASSGDRLLGLFADEGMPRAWDRGSNTPSLAEMTSVSLRTLNRRQEGFFLMVEGSQIDWAAHKNSVVGVISEMEDFVEAVGLVLDFARNQGDTLVIITADHETGGMTIGRDNIYRWDARPLRGVKRTPQEMAQQYISSEESLSDIVASQVPFELSTTEAEELDKAPREDLPARAALANLFNHRTMTGWASKGHTGVDVPIYVFGPGSEHFGGVMQNEAVGRVLWQVFLPE